MMVRFIVGFLDAKSIGESCLQMRPLHHALDRVRVELAAVLVEIAGSFQLGTDPPQRHPLTRLRASRCRRLARATASGLSSTCALRPSHLPRLLARVAGNGVKVVTVETAIGPRPHRAVTRRR